jgi:hypothetical protein
MAGCNNVQVIAPTECIGDSLTKINNNFTNLDTALCTTYTGVVTLSSLYTTTMAFSAVNKTAQGLKAIAPGSTVSAPVWYNYLTITNIPSNPNKPRIIQATGRINFESNASGAPGYAVIDFFGRLIVNDTQIIDINGSNCHVSYSSTHHLLLNGTYTIPAGTGVNSVKLQLANPYDTNPTINGNHFWNNNLYTTNNNIYYASRLDVILF